MATAVNITCANCFHQRAQVPAGCTHLHSTEQSEDMALRKGRRLQWMGLQRHRQMLSNTRDSACHKGPINIWRQIHTCPVLWVILTLVSAFCLAANYAMLIPHHLIGNRRGLGMGQWGPGISPAKRGTWELCTGENSVLRNSLGSWDYQETQATMDNIG